ncbi:MAG: hypothetical protein RIN55_00575 [Tissierellaceae bacterium]|nr:hypothetical protein [Tissierellaceae bacterium]
MKRKLFVLVVFLVVIISLFMTGCKKKIEEKITEKIIEDVSTIKTDRGETKMGEDLKWPGDKMGDLPELKANINMVIEDKDKEKDINLSMVYFDNMKESDAQKYVELIKDLNYESVFETSSDDGFMFSGNNDDGAEVIFSYSNDGTGSLSYTDKQFMFVDNPYDGEFTGDPSTSEDIDMTDDVSWPVDFFKDIPELEGKITQITSSSPSDKYVYIQYVIKEIAIDYIEKLKEVGFVDTPYESISGDYINYEAGNEKGDYIVFSWSNDDATINLMKGE